MKKQEILSLFAILTLFFIPPFLYLLSIRLASIILDIESFHFIGDIVCGVVASVFFFLVMLVLDISIKRLNIKGIKEIILTLSVGFFSIYCMTFLVYQDEKQSIITSIIFTLLFLGYAYLVKERYKTLSDS